jgi:hypothetical protein
MEGQQQFKGEHERGRSRLHYFFLEEPSDFFELSDFELSVFLELSDFEESSDLDLDSLSEEESPFDEDEAEPVEDFLA